MSGRPDAKLKLLYLKEILEKYSDEEHIINAVEITDHLRSDYGMDCERKSIYKDVEVLQSYGVDVLSTRSPKKGFFVASGKFEPAELRLLSDAVQAANFITPKKSKALLGKIESFSSIYQAETLRRQVYMDSRTKSDNEAIYLNISALDEAIKNGKKVRLTYSRRKLDEKFAARKERRIFTLSPYGLIWSNDHYYLVANKGNYNNLMNLRVDRISHVEILPDDARPVSEVSDYKNGFDPADYAAKSFNMYSGRAEDIELKCDNAILEEMFDRFGKRAHTRVAEEGSFLLRTEAAVNSGLVGWILQFGNRIEVIKPAKLRYMVAEQAQAVLRVYEKKDAVQEL